MDKTKKMILIIVVCITFLTVMPAAFIGMILFAVADKVYKLSHRVEEELCDGK